MRLLQRVGSLNPDVSVCLKLVRCCASCVIFLWCHVAARSWTKLSRWRARTRRFFHLLRRSVLLSDSLELTVLPN